MTVLFVTWLVWWKFRIVIVLRDQTAPMVFAALGGTPRIVGDRPTYVPIDSEKKVAVTSIAGVPVRNLQTVDLARLCCVKVFTCPPADPAIKGRSESSIKLAEADIVPQDTSFRQDYDSLAQIEEARQELVDGVNNQEHRATRHRPHGRFRSVSRRPRKNLGDPV